MPRILTIEEVFVLLLLECGKSELRLVSRTGRTFVNGTVRSATIEAGGAASVSVAGLEEDAEVNLGGTATVYLGVTSGALFVIKSAAIDSLL